jgi:hypothetical protein
MINESRIRWKLLQLVLLVSLVTLVTAAILDVALQAKSASLSTQSEMTNRWLRGEVFKSNDRRLSVIIEQLAADLYRARTHFVTPQGQMTAAPMYEAADPRTAPKETFDLPVKKDQVYIAFDGFTYYEFDPAGFVDTSKTPPAKPEAKDYNRDKLSYPAFMFPYYKAVREAGIVKGKDTVEAAMQKYSDAVFRSLRVEQDLTDKSPKLTIGNIFVADDTNGTLAIFPWNSLNLAKMRPEDWDFKTRPWRKSAYAKPEDTNGTELFSIPENNDPTSAFGLSPFYVDAVTGDYTRTLWHRFTVRTEWGKETTYILCMDLNLSSSLPPLLTGNFMPSWIVERGGLSETLMVGLFSGLIVLVIGSILTLLLSRLRPQLLSYFLVRGQTKEWVTEESYIPIEQAFAPQRSITFIDTNQHQSGVERKVNFSAWFQMNVAKLSFEKSRHDKELSQTEKREEVTLNTIDKDPSIRGYEVWRVFRSRWRSEGSCRLCGQEVKYKATDEPIAEPTIRHRRTQIPAIDTRLATNSAVKDTRALEEAIIWQATDVKPGVLGTAYLLKPGPPPRIPQTIQDLSEFKQSLKAFNMLSQSRIDVGDCVRLSSELFPNRNVRAVCHVDYFRKIASDDSSLAALKQGKNIERILVANKPEDMVQFLSRYRDTLEDLLNARNQELFRLYLDDTGVDFSTFGNQRFDLDFAIVYGDNELPLVLASNLSELHSGGSVKGYLSWRMVDVYFFQTLYESFTDKRVILRLDDLPQVGSEVQLSDHSEQ